MIPVTQTKVVVKNSKGEMIVRGNCFAACIASLLEMPISEIPNIETLYGIDGTYYLEVLWRWLGHLGYELITDERFRVYHNKDYLKGASQQIDELRLSLKDQYYLVSGISQRGISHITIWQNGKMVHDPHPTKEGITTFDTFQTLEKNKNDRK